MANQLRRLERVSENLDLPRNLQECEAEIQRLLREEAAIKCQMQAREDADWQKRAQHALRHKRRRLSQLFVQKKHLLKQGGSGGEWKLLLRAKQVMFRLVTADPGPEFDLAIDDVKAFCDDVDRLIPTEWQKKQGVEIDDDAE